MPTPTNPSITNDQTAKEKRSKGVFPRLPLSKTIELVKAIYDLGEGDQVRRISVFNKLNKTAESGPSRSLITAANSGYGLIIGGPQAEYLGITNRGRDIISSNIRTKYLAIYEALFSNEMFSSFITKYYQKSISNDEVAQDYLKQTFKLSDADSKSLLEVIKDNITTYGLTQEFSGKRIVVSREMALEKLPISDSEEKSDDTLSENNSSSSPSIPSPNLNIPPSNTPVNNIPLSSVKTDPQFHFNIQIHLPENATPETYDAIFKSISTYLLGRSNED